MAKLPKTRKPAIKPTTKLKPEHCLAMVFPPKAGWKSAPKHAVRHDGWKLITTDGSKETQLFDLTDDPAETENRAGGKAPEEARLRLRLREWMDGAPLAAGAYPELSDEERRNLKNLGYIEE